MNQQTTTVISLLCAFRTPIKMAELAIKANVSQRVLRLIIADIRENNLIDGYVLCSSDEGYFLSNDADTINQFLNRYLSYAYTIIRVAKTAKVFLSENDVNKIQLQLNF